MSDILQYPFDSALVLQKKRALKRELLEKPGLIDKKIALLSGSTIGEFKNILELFLLQLGIRPEFYEGGYGLFYENLVFDDGSLAAFGPDVVYLHTSVRNLRHFPTPGDDAATAAQKAEAEAAYFVNAAKAAAPLACPVVVNNFELPAFRNFGNLDGFDARGRVYHVRSVNQKLAQAAMDIPYLYLHDLAYLSAMLGSDAFNDSATWYAYKYLCAVVYIPDFCHSLAALLGSLFGRGKKAVITDLDNTLWGGVIGEEGPDGIELGDETPAGMAYAELQRYLKMLAGRGVLLNVASKNEDAAARAGFAREDSPLKAEDFLCFEAHWQPKSESLARMAETLNILPDSFVFLDDNPAERAQVQSVLPSVTAPPVEAGAPEKTIRLVDRAGYFEAAALSADDLQRGEMYRQNAERLQLETAAGSYEEYLESLSMTAHIGPFRPETLERVTQLINKTNQFNLTTRRYSAAETGACMQSPEYITLAGRLTDKFGDNGLTSVIIGRKTTPATLDIELWIMSCRVFKRHFEYAMFDALVAACKTAGITRLTGRYLPTAKNLLVQGFYATIGFELVEEKEGGERLYTFTIPEDFRPLGGVIKTTKGA